MDVPNQRHPNQILIAFALDKQLRGAIDVARKQEGRDQSTFIRLAIIEKLQRLHVPVDPGLAFAPDRINSAKIQKVADDIVEETIRNVRSRRKPAA